MFSSFSTHGRLIKLWFWNNSRVISYWTNGVYWRVVYILRLPGWHEVQYPVCPMLWCSHSKVLCSSLKSTFGWVVEDFHKTISSRFLYDISKTFLSASLSLFLSFQTTLMVIVCEKSHHWCLFLGILDL